MSQAKNTDPMVDHVVHEFTRYENHWSDRMDKARDIYDLWKNKKPMRSYDWQNQVAVPLLVEAEQSISSRLFTALFPTEAPLDVRVEGDAKPTQGIRIKGILEHFFRAAAVKSRSLPMLRQSVLFGTGYLDVGTWYTKKQWLMKGDNRREEIVESRPACNFVDFFEMFPHPEKLDVGDGLPIIRRSYRDAEYLKRLADNGFFDTGNLKEALETSLPDVSGSGSATQKKRDRYEILEYWGPYTKEYTEKSDNNAVTREKVIPHWIIVVNRKVKVRGIENPYNHQTEPYVRVKYLDDAKPSWFGVGVGEIGKPTVDRIQKIVNQRLDNVDLVLNRQGIYNGYDTLINPRKLKVSAPGQFHKASDINNIKFMNIPDVTQSSYEEERIAKDDFRESTGATQYLQPTEGPKHRTAMGIQMLQGAAGIRFKPILAKMELEFIQKAALFFFSNLQQFLPLGKWVTITGDSGKKEPIMIEPKDIQAKVSFIPTGVSETVNKETQVQQLLRYKELTRDDPTINRSEINRRIGELFGFKDLDKMIVQQDPPMMGTSLSAKQQAMVNQRLAEGATPRQIQQEVMGPIPVEGGQQ